MGNVNELNENINMKISKEEILKCIKKLKNNKACGEDLVINDPFYHLCFCRWVLYYP
jgi:hypothetical protein